MKLDLNIGPLGPDGTIKLQAFVALARQGEQGIQGPQGDTGPQGPQGIQGPQGEQGPGIEPDDSRLSDAREWTAATVDQPEAEAGTATTRRAWTAQRVRQAMLGWWGGFAAKTAPVDADSIVIADSAAANAPKRLSWANAVAKLRGTFVEGPASAVDGQVMVFDGATGKKAIAGPIVAANATNLKIGSNAPLSSGSYSTAYGAATHETISTATGCMAMGYSAQRYLTTGSLNVAIGYMTQASLQTSDYNTAVGSRAQMVLTTGSANTAVGNQAQGSLTTGGTNTAVGYFAQSSLTTGGANTAVGLRAASTLTTGSQNVMVGQDAGNALVGGGAVTNQSNSIYIGVNSKALTDAASFEIVIGAAAVGCGSQTATIGSSANKYLKTHGAFVSGAAVVGMLPAGLPDGSIYFASNGRKVGETAGNGTGVPVYFSNAKWRVFSTDAEVAA